MRPARAAAMIISVLPDAGALGRVAAEQFLELAQAAVLARGRFTVALAGGSTPRRMYEILAGPAFRHRVDCPSSIARARSGCSSPARTSRSRSAQSCRDRMN